MPSPTRYQSMQRSLAEEMDRRIMTAISGGEILTTPSYFKWGEDRSYLSHEIAASHAAAKAKPPYREPEVIEPFSIAGQRKILTNAIKNLLEVADRVSRSMTENGATAEQIRIGTEALRDTAALYDRQRSALPVPGDVDVAFAGFLASTPDAAEYQRTMASLTRRAESVADWSGIGFFSSPAPFTISDYEQQPPQDWEIERVRVSGRESRRTWEIERRYSRTTTGWRHVVRVPDA